MKKLIVLFGFVFVFGISASAQCPQMPTGFICLSQAAANQAAEDHKVRKVLEDEVVPELKSALAVERENVVKAKQTSIENQAKFEEQLHKTDVALAEKTGQLTKCEAFAVRDAALIEFLVKNQRSKQNGFLNIKLGGN